MPEKPTGSTPRPDTAPARASSALGGRTVAAARRRAPSGRARNFRPRRTHMRPRAKSAKVLRIASTTHQRTATNRTRAMEWLPELPARFDLMKTCRAEQPCDVVCGGEIEESCTAQ